IDNYYGYQSNGYFQDQTEVDATDAKLPNTLPGDIKYVDQNGDGVINDMDRVDLGDPFPHLNYSVTLDLRYKKWDFSMLGVGVGKRTGRLAGLEGYPVLVDGTDNNMGSPRQYYMDNRWTPDNPNARFPRVWTGNSSNAVLSDVWLSDAAFFRIKTIQLGYTFPQLGSSIRNFRVYVNAQDAITFTNWEGLEPERNGGNGNYPRMATFNCGINATILSRIKFIKIKKIQIYFIVLLTFAPTGCEKFLDRIDPTAMAFTEFFNTEADLQRVAYSSFYDVFTNHTNRRTLFYMLDGRSDNGYSRVEGDHHQIMANGNFNSNSRAAEYYYTLHLKH